MVARPETTLTVAGGATGADGQSMVWVRPLDSLAAQALPGTEGGALPSLLVARQPEPARTPGRCRGRNSGTLAREPLETAAAASALLDAQYRCYSDQTGRSEIQ